MSSHRRFAAAELKRTSPSPRVVSSESDDDVPEVSHPSQPRVSSPRGDVVHGKRARRVWTKRVKYDVRKNFAETRLRVKGRFVKKEEEDLLKDLVGVV